MGDSDGATSDGVAGEREHGGLSNGEVCVRCNNKMVPVVIHDRAGDEAPSVVMRCTCTVDHARMDYSSVMALMKDSGEERDDEGLVPGTRESILPSCRRAVVHWEGGDYHDVHTLTLDREWQAPLSKV